MRTWCVAAVLAAVGVSGGASVAQPAPGGGPRVAARSAEATLRGLQDVFSRCTRLGELCASGAKKAEAEGWGAAASLLRASGRALEVHGARARAQIEGLGAEAKVAADGQSLAVKGTVENLALLERGLGELGGALASVRESAEKEGRSESARAARVARAGVTELARLVKAVGSEPEEARKRGRAYYIGRTCGLVAEKLPRARCAVCGKGRDDFEKVE